MSEWIKISDLATANLPDTVKIQMLSTVLAELGVAVSYMMALGDRMGADRYASEGRVLRFTREGEPLVQIMDASDHVDEDTPVVDLKTQEKFTSVGIVPEYATGGKITEADAAAMQTPATQPAYSDGEPR